MAHTYGGGRSERSEGGPQSSAAHGRKPQPQHGQEPRIDKPGQEQPRYRGAVQSSRQQAQSPDQAQPQPGSAHTENTTQPLRIQDAARAEGTGQQAVERLPVALARDAAGG